MEEKTFRRGPLETLRSGAAEAAAARAAAEAAAAATAAA